MTTTPAWHPVLPPGALLRHDPVRAADVLLLPERVVVLHGSALGRLVYVRIYPKGEPE